MDGVRRIVPVFLCPFGRAVRTLLRACREQGAPLGDFGVHVVRVVQGERLGRGGLFGRAELRFAVMAGDEVAEVQGQIGFQT